MLLPLWWAADPFSLQDTKTLQCSSCGKQFLCSLTESQHQQQHQGNNDTCFCRLNCGTPYCNEECRDEAFGKHRFLCVGPLENTHAIYLYKVMTLESGRGDVYATFALALELLCGHPEVVLEILENNNSTTDNNDETTEYDDYFTTNNNGETVSLIEESHKLVCQILESDHFCTNKNDQEDPPNSSMLRQVLIEQSSWKRLLAYVNCKRISIAIPSAWSEVCRKLTSSDSWTMDHPVITEANSRWHDDDDDDNSEENGPKVDMVQLMDEPDFYFPPQMCSALFSPGFSNNFSHSCLPTHEISAQDGEGVMVELRSIRKETGGRLLSNHDDRDKGTVATTTISLIEYEGNLEERTELLYQRGIYACDCVRCCFERQYQQPQDDEREEDDNNDDDESSSSSHCFTPDSLARLLELAKSQQRHEDAALICDKLLELNGKDAQALLDRARIAGWMGNFCLREALLAKAVRIVPEDGPIRGALLELRAYYRNDDWDAVTTNSTIIRSSFHSRPIVGLDGRAFVTEGLLHPSECAEMIEVAENYQSSKLGGGWTTSRHYAVPTTDVPIYQMPRVLTWFNQTLETSIFPMLGEHFDFSPPGGRLRIFDAFFVKYDASSGQKRLPLHNDQSVYSLTIAMNSPESYEGGGTYFAETGQAYKTDVGGVVSFEGELLHAGRNIESGTRYIIACFIYVEEKDNKSAIST